MDMKTGFQIAKLVYKAKQGKLTEDEQAVLEEWMAEDEGRRRLVERICGEEYWEGQWVEHHAYDVERGWRRFRREVRALEARKRLVRWGSVAAGIAVVAGAVLFVVERKGTDPAVMPVVEAVEPGRSVAVLTLVEGSVAVDAGREERVLVPGEQLSRDMDGTVAVRKVDTEAYGAWRNRRFVFEDDLLGTVLGKLEHWYDVEFFIQHSSLEELRFTGNLPKYENLEEVLRKLEQTTYIHFERKGRTVVVSEER